MRDPTPLALPWRRAIVIGASSGIGAAMARTLVRAGCRTAVVARRKDLLDRLVDEMRAGGGDAQAHVHDVTSFNEVPALLARIRENLGGLDLFVYAAGVMPRIDEQTFDFATDRAIVEVNLLGAMAWLNAVAVHFAHDRAGTIVGISSVAGDRGRRGNPAYAASKAALSTYLEALRNRLARVGVTVVTAKPGPVDTAMSSGLDRLPFLISADAAAAAILAAARRGVATTYVPARWRAIMFVLRHIPSIVFRRLDL
jgi:short-subunit dehydrogenase